VEVWYTHVHIVVLLVSGNILCKGQVCMARSDVLTNLTTVTNVTVNHWTIRYRTFCSASIRLSENTFISIFRVEIEKLSVSLKVEEEVSSETLVPKYQITVHHIADSHNIGIHRCHK
jgi:hypothetical protein